jgi:hypothetical protein
MIIKFTNHEHLACHKLSPCCKYRPRVCNSTVADGATYVVDHVSAAFK